jgi:hypothetical protein
MTTDRARPLAAFVLVTLLCTAILVLNLAQSPRSVVVAASGVSDVGAGPDVIFGNVLAGAPVEVTASAFVTRPALARTVAHKTKATAHRANAVDRAAKHANATRKSPVTVRTHNPAHQTHPLTVPFDRLPGAPWQHQHQPVRAQSHGPQAHGAGHWSVRGQHDGRSRGNAFGHGNSSGHGGHYAGGHHRR